MTTALQCIHKFLNPSNPAGFEPGNFYSVGRRDDHYYTTPLGRGQYDDNYFRRFSPIFGERIGGFSRKQVFWSFFSWTSNRYFCLKCRFSANSFHHKSNYNIGPSFYISSYLGGHTLHIRSKGVNFSSGGQLHPWRWNFAPRCDIQYIWVAMNWGVKKNMVWNISVELFPKFQM
jgi:hypothetical protein